VDDSLRCRLVKKFAERGKLRSGSIEFLGSHRCVQLLDMGFQSTFRGAISSTTLEGLAKPLFGTLDIRHVNNSSKFMST
jgi:hypothetical protein